MLGVTSGRLKKELNKLNDGIFGVNQTWQNVESSRSNNVTYTNTTGKPISVFVTYYDTRGSTTQGAGCLVYINNVLMTSASYWLGRAFFIVPNGATYRVNYLESAYDRVWHWFELR